MQPAGEKTCARGLTVGEGDNLARSFRLCHSPDILYRIGLALAGLSTEMVREVSSDLWGVLAVGGDPLKAEAGESDVGAGDGEKEELCIVEVDLNEGEASERGGEESHGEEPSLEGAENLYFSACRRCTERVHSVPRERDPEQPSRASKAPVTRMQPQPSVIFKTSLHSSELPAYADVFRFVSLSPPGALPKSPS